MDKKLLFYRTTTLLGRLMPDHGLSVLCYHSIDDSGSRISLAVDTFGMHMRLLHELGYRSMRLSDAIACLRAGQPFPKKTVVITFDDGFENIYRCAAPAMQQYGFVGSIFIIGGMVGKTILWKNRDGWLPQLPVMSWGQVGELHALGFEVGAHSISHRYLTQLSDQQLRDEVAGSKELIEQMIGAQVTTFSYPFGDYDRRVIGVVAGAGYQGACTTVPTRASLTDDVFALPRLFIARDTPATILKAYLTPGAAVGFRVISTIRERILGHKRWYVPDPSSTDSTGTVAPPAALLEKHVSR